jgi:hypothetical protein
MPLWDKFRYRSKTECIIDYPIREYDIRKANISVLFDAGVISKDQYEYLYNADRMVRQVFVGKLEGENPNVARTLSNGILQAKKKFFELNGIESNEVLEIDNDAVFIIGNRPIKYQSVSDHVYFKESSLNNSFYRVGGIEFFYYYNIMEGVERLNPKGLGDSAACLHERYMLDFLKELFCRAHTEGVQSALNLLTRFHDAYINLSLDIGYYRELNSQAMFRIKRYENYIPFMSTCVDTPIDKKYMDISYNEFVLRKFYGLLVEKNLGRA